MVATPLIMIASWGLSPMTSGKTKVAPNIATTCWAPRPAVLPQDRRSSGATTSSGPSARPSFFRVHPKPSAMACSFLAEIRSTAAPVTRLTSVIHGR